jgi:hypothetical protein
VERKNNGSVEEAGWTHEDLGADCCFGSLCGYNISRLNASRLVARGEGVLGCGVYLSYAYPAVDVVGLTRGD